MMLQQLVTYKSIFHLPLKYIFNVVLLLNMYCTFWFQSVLLLSIQSIGKYNTIYQTFNVVVECGPQEMTISLVFDTKNKKMFLHLNVQMCKKEKQRFSCNISGTTYHLCHYFTYTSDLCVLDIGTFISFLWRQLIVHHC